MVDATSVVGTFRRFAALQRRDSDWGEPDMQMVARGDHIGADDPARFHTTKTPTGHSRASVAALQPGLSHPVNEMGNHFCRFGGI
jgi:hypothetical protein